MKVRTSVKKGRGKLVRRKKRLRRIVIDINVPLKEKQTQG